MEVWSGRGTSALVRKAWGVTATVLCGWQRAGSGACGDERCWESNRENQFTNSELHDLVHVKAFRGEWVASRGFVLEWHVNHKYSDVNVFVRET